MLGVALSGPDVPTSFWLQCSLEVTPHCVVLTHAWPESENFDAKDCRQELKQQKLHSAALRLELMCKVAVLSP